MRGIARNRDQPGESRCVQSQLRGRRRPECEYYRPVREYRRRTLHDRGRELRYARLERQLHNKLRNRQRDHWHLLRRPDQRGGSVRRGGRHWQIPGRNLHRALQRRADHDAHHGHQLLRLLAVGAGLGQPGGVLQNNVLLYNFTPNNLIAALGACSAANAYCGNPNAQFPKSNNTQLYAFVNFLDTNGTFDSVRFQENPARGSYESDNHTVGFATTVSGTNVPVPEPASLVLLAFALAALGVGRGRPACRAKA